MTRQKKFTIIGIIATIAIVTFVLFSISGRQQIGLVYQDAAYAPESASMQEFAFDAIEEVESVALGRTTAGVAALDVDTNSIPAQERLIIRTGNLSIVVADTEVAIETITQIANELNGWVVSSNTYNYNGALSGDITIRIPAAQFDEVTSGVKGLAIEITSESSYGQDVTEEFVDLDARLGNLEATADRVRGFLAETENVEEALAVNIELSRLEGEIEVIKGRMKYLSESAAFSTITISLTPDELNQPIEVAGWRPQGIARDAIEALIVTFQGLASVLIWIGLYILPLAIAVGIPGYFGGRWLVRRWRARQATQTSE